MILDINRYRLSIPFITYLMDRSEPQDRFGATMSIAAIACHCHIVAVAYFTAEIYGMSNETQLLIQSLMKYYRIKGVIGVNHDEIKKI